MTPRATISAALLWLGAGLTAAQAAPGDGGAPPGALAGEGRRPRETRAEAPSRGGGLAQAAGLAGIEVSFRVDPRLTRGLYLGDRWVSPHKFTAAPAGRTATVKASARGLDAHGRRVAIDAEWIPADPGMVEVTRSGKDVDITVRRAGETRLVVVFQGFTKELIIRASERGQALSVEIAQ